MTTTRQRQANQITVYVEQKGENWVATSPDAPGLIGISPVRGGLGNNSGFEKALDQWRKAYVADARKSGFGGIAELKAALKKPAVRSRFLGADLVEVVLRTGGEDD